jgi:hypothetical protein
MAMCEQMMIRFIKKNEDMIMESMKADAPMSVKSLLASAPMSYEVYCVTCCNPFIIKMERALCVLLGRRDMETAVIQWCCDHREAHVVVHPQCRV